MFHQIPWHEIGATLGWSCVIAVAIFTVAMLFISLFDPAPRRRFPRTSNAGTDYLHDANSLNTQEEVE